MNKYLLLRDNKQTGPHSLDEIREMGLKKYDLIWVEGKSAAWRYPGEIEEMKAFAPAVEEQPFDRFFRKPVMEEHYQLQQKKEEAMGSLGAIEKPVKKEDNKNRQRKYVSISMPRSSNIKTEPVKTEQPKKEPKAKPMDQVAEKETPALEPIFPPKENRLSQPVIEPVPEKSDRLVDSRLAVPAADRYSLPEILQYTALGLGVFSILLIIYLVTSGQDQYYSTLPVQKTVSAVKQPVPGPVVREMTPIPAVSSTTNTTPVPDVSQKVQGAVAASNTVSKAGGTKEDAGALVKPASLVKDPASKVVSLAPMVVAKLSDYRVNVLGGIDDVNVELSNKSDYQLDLVVVEVQYLQSNKKIFKTETLRFRDVAPGEVAVLHLPKSNRGVKVNSRVTYITSSQAGVSENL